MDSIIVYLRKSDDHIQFVVYRTSNACVQKVPLVKKWGKYIPRRGVKLEIADFRILILLLLLLLLLWFDSRSSLTAANMTLGREMKLCDPTNNVMFKICNFLENNNKQLRAIH